MVGEYNYFYQQDSNFILNLFEVSPSSITSPILRLSILRLLIDIYSENSKSEKIYLSVENILNYFEPATVSRIVVEEHLKALLNYRLIEPYDPTDTLIYESQRVKVTHSGRIHYEFAVEDKEGIYMSEMALITSVSSHNYVAQVGNLMNHRKLNRQDWITIIKWFVEYCLKQDSLYISLPQSNLYNSQRILREKLRQAWSK